MVDSHSCGAKSLYTMCTDDKCWSCVDMRNKANSQVKNSWMKNELFLCPFCGKEIKIVKNPVDFSCSSYHSAEMRGHDELCFLAVSAIYRGSAENICNMTEKWNTRTNKAEKVLAELKAWLHSKGGTSQYDALIRLSEIENKVKRLQ